MASKRIAVVGGGVIGVTSALRVLETLDRVEVTLLSEKFSPETTGDGSAGFIMPFCLGEDVDKELVRRWCIETMEYYRKIAKSEEAGQLGVGFLQGYWISENDDVHKIVEFEETLFHWQQMTPKQLTMFPSEYKFGIAGTSIYAECMRLLPGLMKRFQDLGGRILKKRVDKLEELVDSYDVVVNCTGLGAGQLVSDSSLCPVRGQVIKVRAPWIKHAIVTPKFHILPCSEVVTLGGTKQKGNWSTKANEDDKERIWNGCCEILPSIKNAEIIKDWVGLRPFRDSIRLEREQIHKGGKILNNTRHHFRTGTAPELLQLYRKLQSCSTSKLTQFLPILAFFLY